MALDAEDPSRLVLRGDIDVYAVAGQRLAPEQLSEVRVVDLHDVEFVDSAGLGFLIGLSRQVRPYRLRLEGLHGTARQMLVVMGAHHVLDL
ncbi:anti-anti-sigma factor [Quadrisphaera granulorum]|uniref:Anti-anti-sigma factor n=2 Tax=Quadrisphaera granulorum TaxID=317664 RepID=A0A315ZRU8_9ACTN|nr:anti-anti-sigma factor [Quadrisphaera granulorum]SZE98620.1 anti-anti-sigma factor [Quadrisphaera granulorum]